MAYLPPGFSPAVYTIDNRVLKGFQRAITSDGEVLEAIAAGVQKLPWKRVEKITIAEEVQKKYQWPASFVVAPEADLWKAIPELNHTTQKVFGWLNEFFQSAPLTFSEQRPTRVMEAENFCLEKLGIASTLLPDHLSEEELQILNLTEELVSQYPHVELRKMSCFQFTLLRVRDVATREISFVEKDETILTKLHRWGYQTEFQPKPGDLVIYLDEGKAEHMGLMLENGQVESKFGKDMPYLYRHPVHLMWRECGLQVMFFRKNSAGSYYV